MTISIIAIAIIGFSGIAQADQFQVVMDAFDKYNRSLMTGTEYQPIQQPQQYQQPVQQPQQYVQYQVPQQISYPPQQTQQPVQYVQYQPQPVQYVPVQQVQQPQRYQEQPSTMRDTVQNVASMANDLSYGIQTVKSITNMFKGGF